MREVFEIFAKSMSMDPLEPENWYSISRKQFALVEVYSCFYARKDSNHKQGGSTILNVYFRGSLVKALPQIFPEVKFDIKKFVIRPRK